MPELSRRYPNQPHSGREKWKAAALVFSGLCSLSRMRGAAEGSILNFHGLCEGQGDERVMDRSLHLGVETFRRVCAYLAAHYRVIPMSELVTTLQAGTELPPNFVALNFDDGYASNYELAFPILKEFGLPATIFVTTGFLDGTERLWFHRLDLAFSNTRKTSLAWDFGHGEEQLPLATPAQRHEALLRALPVFKCMNEELFRREIDRMETLLEVPVLKGDDIPVPMRPLSWAQAREMRDSGLVEIGAHTHTHPILSRCTPASLRREILTCRDRIAQELGTVPKVFAIPNGGPADYNAETLAELQSAGFTAACTMRNARVSAASPLMELPRYGSPESEWEAEATVSGGFETIKAWRQGLKRLFFDRPVTS